MTSAAKLVSSAAAVALAVAAQPVAGQSIAERVAAVEDGKVRFSYAARPDVCGNGRNHISFGEGRITWRGHSDDWESDCEHGPVRLVLRVRRGEVRDIDTYVGGRWRESSSAIDIGTVPASAAVDYLISVAEHSEGDVAEDAIFPLVLADGVTVWPDLLRLARDNSLRRNTRKTAVFWLGQAAGEAATAGLDSIVEEPSADREVRESAIFALSQRPHDEGVPALIRIARTNPDFGLRKKALFWLGQSGDPRAIDLFEELLLTNQ